MQRNSDVISSIKHAAVVSARRSLARSSGAPPGAFLAEGHKLIAEALDARAPVQSAFFRQPVEDPRVGQLLTRARAAGADCHVVTSGVFFRILDLGYQTSAAALAVVTRPAPHDAVEAVHDGFCALAGQRIQDPRNVGVLIRTADAMGLDCVVLSADSADPYSRPSVRSSTGSIFRVPITSAGRFGEYLAALKAAGVRLIGTSAAASAPCREADFTGPCAVVVGNESVGLTPETAAACDEMVTIPMPGGAHSFNVTVAAGILLYERARQRNSPPPTSG